MKTSPETQATAAVRLESAAVAFHGRTLWEGLNLDVSPGEFIAVLGPNGCGKSTLLKVLLGVMPLAAGQAWVAGRPVGARHTGVGYIPQHHMLESSTPLRAQDLVALGLEGHRYGLRLRGRKAFRNRINELLDEVGASNYAQMPVGLLSGGEQQRLRAAQALADNPKVLLCDEPLHSLDLYHQEAITALINRQRREHGTAVLFVTHEINPILDYVDRVLYFASGQYRLGTPDEVMTTETLSELYGSEVHVLRHDGRLLVYAAHHEGHHAGQSCALNPVLLHSGLGDTRDKVGL